MGQQRICMACSSIESGGSAHLSCLKKSRGEWVIPYGLYATWMHPRLLSCFSVISNCFWLNHAGLQSGYRLPLRWQEVTLRIISIDLGRGWMLLHWTCCSSTGMFVAHKVTITVITFECHFLSMPSSMLEATAEIWKWVCKWICSAVFAGNFAMVYHSKKIIH
jgi:hypothetical protein